ncbi:MAG: hypothetical protein ACE5H8_15500 [Alphaproteobacteria bacterium]
MTKGIFKALFGIYVLGAVIAGFIYLYDQHAGIVTSELVSQTLKQGIIWPISVVAKFI